MYLLLRIALSNWDLHSGKKYPGKFFELLIGLKSIFSWISIAQKANEIFDKILPYEEMVHHCQVVHYLAVPYNQVWLYYRKLHFPLKVAASTKAYILHNL